MSDIKPVANTLRQASISLSGYQVLIPGTPEYEQFYVPRPQVESGLLREAERSEQAQFAFHWFFTGHTGSGKSTELNRLRADPRLTTGYLPVYVDLESDFDIHNIAYADLILAMGKGCARQADDLNCPVPRELSKAIDRWGADIFTEEDLVTRTEGQAGLKVSLPFLALGEEVRSGGGKRELIRRNISTNVLGFIRLIDELAEALLKHTGRRVLCVLDGLDHVDSEPCFELLNNHFETLTLPRISKIIVIPLALLNTPFIATIGRQFSTVPNVKVFAEAGSEEIDAGGFAFYREVISRYVPLDLFTEDALLSLFLLSAGIVRDMIRNTGDACGYAHEAGASQVAVEHAEQVWNEIKRYYRSQLHKQDYAVLREVESHPYLQGIDGVPPLLHSKAVIFYPDGEGWYGVHPAIRPMLT